MSSCQLANSRVSSHGSDESRTLFAVNLGLCPQVDPHNEDVGQDIQSTDAHQNIGVIEGNLLGQLHHHQDDGQVGTA